MNHAAPHTRLSLRERVKDLFLQVVELTFIVQIAVLAVLIFAALAASLVGPIALGLALDPSGPAGGLIGTAVGLTLVSVEIGVMLVLWD